MTAALVALLLAPAPGRAAPRSVTSADLPRLTAELAAVTAQAQALTAALEQASARDGGLRVAYDRAVQSRVQAQYALDVRARQVYMSTASVPLGSWMSNVAVPDLQVVAHRGEQAALQVDRHLIDSVEAQTSQLKALQAQSDAFRRSLLGPARAVLAAQDRARELLGEAQALAAAEHAAEVQRELAAQQAMLDDLSSTTAIALNPGQQQRARAALDREGPIVALLEQSGGNYPAGYAPTGEVITGIASWYGPGFVGNPTASGAPYDPERLTCAHKTLPLGTVIHVSANGYAVNCLVNDRGPYVGDRVLDMSRAGARALGYSGLASVTIEVLAPTR